MKKGRGRGHRETAGGRASKPGTGAQGRTARGGLPALEGGVAILLTALALILMSRFLTHAGPLWRDEVNSVEFARMSGLSEIARNLRFDGFPLLSTLALRGWMSLGLGATDLGLRAYGFLIGVAFLAALWFTSRRLGCRTPLLALALVGLSPWAVSTMASIRPYGIGMVFLTLTLGAVWAATEAGTMRRWLTAGALAILSVQCMYQNAILLLGMGVAAILAALLAGRRGAALGVTLVGLGAALSLLPYVPNIAAARDWNVVIQVPTGWGQLLSTLRIAASGGPPLAEWPWVAAALASLYLGYRSLGQKPKHGAAAPDAPNVAFFAATLLVVTTAVFLLALKSTRLPTEPWYYVPLLVAVIPALDAAIAASFTSVAPRAARLGLVLVVALSASVFAWRQLAERRTNLDRVAAHLAANAVEGDAVIVSPVYYGVAFQRYYKGPARWMTLPPLDETRIHRYDLVKAAMTRTDAVQPAIQAMSEALASGHRVWLVGGLPDPGPNAAAALPVAPSGPMGWYCGPYFVGWGRQASYMLSQHALRGEPVSVPIHGPVNPYENVPMVVVSGWK
jgi:branched-subunit amino acid transport protein AzlD